jgi:hypothetical protein
MHHQEYGPSPRPKVRPETHWTASPKTTGGTSGIGILWPAEIAPARLGSAADAASGCGTNFGLLKMNHPKAQRRPNEITEDAPMMANGVMLTVALPSAALAGVPAYDCRYKAIQPGGTASRATENIAHHFFCSDCIQPFYRKS